MTSKGDLTRQNIIEKSMDLFSVKGFFNTSIADIVEATGLTKGGLYGHFKNKEEIWYAVYEECVRIWKRMVFEGVKEISDPLERIDKVMENSLKNYLGGGVFEGGCFLLNSLVDLAGVAPAMSDHVLSGFTGFAGLLRRWLEEAEDQGLIQEGLNLQEVANFMVISINGAAPLYAASKDPLVWQHTLSQIRVYMRSLRK
jgi:TetR/AcrR family transcriptional repressor of nem operon|uniref:TetR/AcrR family transcriptional regulator n=1 Tax=Desulfobacca acetoxidans TaxID=60893 RepID=A0A7V6A3T7_9BACT